MRVWLLLALGVWGFATVAHAATSPVAANSSRTTREGASGGRLPQIA